MITIKEIKNPDEKTRITLEIMNALPEWFSPPEDIVRKSVIHREYPFIAALDGDKAVGFAALKIHNEYTADLYNFGVLREYHRMGIGHRLMEACVQYGKENHYKFLTVKTLDESAAYEPYNGTRAFYQKEGFYPLEVFTCVWNEENPCLFMLKVIEEREYRRAYMLRGGETLQERTDKKRKIVVMGGSFNPPTVAHERILLAAVRELNADGGIFVPSSDAYVTRKMKRQRCANEVLSEEQRAQMLRAVCAGDERLTVDECEFQDDGRGHTFETMQKLQAKNPDAVLYFLIGGDKLNIITRWGDYEAFFAQFEFAVMKRDGTEPEQQIQSNPRLAENRNIFHMIPEPEGIEGISSTALRDRMRLGDESAAELVNEEVWKMLVEAGWLKTEICSFKEEYSFLSNFYEAPIEYRGLYYLNNEAAFQAQKCVTEEEKRQFTQLPAGKAKRRGRQVQLREDWEEVKVSFMEEIVRAKFSQHPELAERLLATGKRKLLEGNTWHDTFWGVDIQNGKGENHLGEILMKIREELKE